MHGFSRFPTAYRAMMAVCAVLAGVLAGCGSPDSEAALRQAAAELQAAVQARDPGAVRAHLSDDFIGPEGLDRDGARRLVAAHLLRHRQIGVTVGPLDVALSDDATHATVRFRAILTGGSGGLLPDTGNAYQVHSGWRLESGQWRMSSVQWEAMR